MNLVVRSFFQGLLIVAPLALTVYVIYAVVTFVDGALGVPVPGLGILITLLLITLVGFLVSNVVGRRLVKFMEKGIAHLPVVKLVYSSIKDLMGAFVGDKKSFDQPAMVDLTEEHGVRILGFVTCTTFADPNLEGHVAVYVPQSYNFAGNLIIVPRDRVKPVDADGAQFMAFIVSGGVSHMNAARTVMDGRSPLSQI